jgi:hypothetical protein
MLKNLSNSLSGQDNEYNNNNRKKNSSNKIHVENCNSIRNSNDIDKNDNCYRDDDKNIINNIKIDFEKEHTLVTNKKEGEEETLNDSSPLSTYCSSFYLTTNNNIFLVDQSKSNYKSSNSNNNNNNHFHNRSKIHSFGCVTFGQANETTSSTNDIKINIDSFDEAENKSKIEGYSSQDDECFPLKQQQKHQKQQQQAEGKKFTEHLSISSTQSSCSYIWSSTSSNSSSSASSSTSSSSISPSTTQSSLSPTHSESKFENQNSPHLENSQQAFAFALGSGQSVSLLKTAFDQFTKRNNDTEFFKTITLNATADPLDSTASITNLNGTSEALKKLTIVASTCSSNDHKKVKSTNEKEEKGNQLCSLSKNLIIPSNNLSKTLTPKINTNKKQQLDTLMSELNIHSQRTVKNCKVDFDSASKHEEETTNVNNAITSITGCSYANFSNSNSCNALIEQGPKVVTFNAELINQKRLLKCTNFKRNEENETEHEQELDENEMISLKEQHKFHTTSNRNHPTSSENMKTKFNKKDDHLDHYHQELDDYELYLNESSHLASLLKETSTNKLQNSLIISRQGTIRGNLNHVKTSLKQIFKDSNNNQANANNSNNNLLVSNLNNTINNNLSSVNIPVQLNISTNNGTSSNFGSLNKKLNEKSIYYNYLSVRLTFKRIFFFFHFIFYLFNKRGITRKRSIRKLLSTQHHCKLFV